MTADAKVVMHLSPSIAATLLQRSAARAWREHSKGGGEQRDATEPMRRGKLLDRLLFQTGAEIVIVDAPDWRTKVAQSAREEAENRGAIAVLAGKHEEALATANEIRAALFDRGIDLAKGRAQHRVVWDSAGVACKGFLDVLFIDDGEATIYDLKITDDASPGAIKLDFRSSLQHAAYIEAIETLHPELAGRVTMRFVYAEPDGDLTIAEPDGPLRSLGSSRWRRAVALWGECLAMGTFPGYPRDVYRIEGKPWELDAELPKGGSQNVGF